MIHPSSPVVQWKPQTDPHAYYNQLCLHPKLRRNYSFRDQQQLLDARTGPGLPPDVNYLYPDDPDPRQQDAGKVVIPFGVFDYFKPPHGGVSGIRNQARFDSGYQQGKSLFVTWDYWHGKEWAYDWSQQGNSKMFNLLKPAGATYLLTCTEWRTAIPGSIARFTIRGGSPDYPNQDTVPPPIDYYVYPERWTRVWRLQIPNLTDQTFHTWVWFADEQQEPVLVYKEIRFNFPPAGEIIGKFDLEFASSQNYWQVPHIFRPDPANSAVCLFCHGETDHTVEGTHTDYDRGSLVSYVRNLVILTDLTLDEVPPLLQKPIK